MSDIFFSSDFHFGHRNIIRYCSRPFSSVEEMDEALIFNFNSLVKADDLTYHLGDFSMDERLVEQNLKRLNGAHILICGNHDKCHSCHKKSKKFREKYIQWGFKEVCERKIIQIENLGQVLLCHMPKSQQEDPRYEQYRPNDWEGWIFHGHVHNTYKRRDKSINVGIDVWNYHPVSLNQLIKFATNENLS